MRDQVLKETMEKPEIGKVTNLSRKSKKRNSCDKRHKVRYGGSQRKQKQTGKYLTLYAEQGKSQFAFLIKPKP